MKPFAPSGQQVIFGVGVDDNERLFRAVMAQGVLRDIKGIKASLAEIRFGINRTNYLLAGIQKSLKKRLK